MMHKHDLKTPPCCKIQRDLPGADWLHQNCVNVTDVHLCVKVLLWVCEARNDSAVNW